MQNATIKILGIATIALFNVSCGMAGNASIPEPDIRPTYRISETEKALCEILRRQLESTGKLEKGLHFLPDFERPYQWLMIRGPLKFYDDIRDEWFKIDPLRERNYEILGEFPKGQWMTRTSKDLFSQQHPRCLDMSKQLHDNGIGNFQVPLILLPPSGNSYRTFVEWYFYPSMLGPLNLRNLGSSTRDRKELVTDIELEGDQRWLVAKKSLNLHIRAVGSMKLTEGYSLGRLGWWAVGDQIGVSQKPEIHKPLFLFPGTSFFLKNMLVNVDDVSSNKVSLTVEQFSLWGDFEGTSKKFRLKCQTDGVLD